MKEKITKILAVFAVLVMTFGCLTCVVATTDNDASNTLEDKGTVVLDASKDFNGNKDELSKLGITDSADWTKGMSSTTLVLSDVEYKTEKCHAIDIVGSCSELVIEIVGVNNIVCGTDKGSYDYADAIMIDDTVAMTKIQGNGSLRIACDGINVDCGGSALYVVNDLTISGCTIAAIGPSVHQDATNVKSDYSSKGIMVSKGNLIVNDGAYVKAKGGDVFTKSECFVGEYKRATESIGVRVGEVKIASKLTVDGAVLAGFGGTVESQAVGFMDGSGLFNIDVDSCGINVGGEISLRDSTLRGYGGTSIGDHNLLTEEISARHVSSEGLEFNANITSTGSEIFMIGGKAVSCELAVSAGIRHFKELQAEVSAKVLKMEITDSDVYAMGYEAVCNKTFSRGPMGGSFGLIASELGGEALDFNLTINLKDSIANFCGFELKTDTPNSVGIRVLGIVPDFESTTKIEPRGNITVENSELYIVGYTKAIIAQSVTDANYKFSCASNETYEFDNNVAPSEFITGNYKTCCVGSHYLLYTCTTDTIYTRVLVYQFDEKSTTLPEYELSATPEGKRFKCWSIDGVEYQPGETIELGVEPVTAIAVWEDDVANSNDNTVALVCIVIGMVVAALALIAFIWFMKPKVIAKSAPKAKTTSKKVAKKRK